MKMKRTKIEMINATVESYLKRRRYQDNGLFRRTDRTDCRSSEEMTLSAKAESAVSRDNAIVFSAIINDIVTADQAYQRLKAWVYSVKAEKIKHELNGLLYPVFCHLYLEILHAGNPQAALQFMKNHQNEFVLDTERDFLEELSSVFTIQDIELRPLVNAFRMRKYKVDMSDEAHICLQKYLTKHGHIIIMQIINIHITIIRKIIDMTVIDEDTVDRTPGHDSGINGHVEQASGTGVDREMRELQESIRLIRNNNICQPLRIFTVNNAIENGSCARMTPNMDKLVAGFNTAEIRLWGVGDTVLMRPRHTKSPTMLDCDSVSTILPFENHHQHQIEEAGAIILRGHTDVIHDVKFVAQSTVLLSASSDKDMRAWSLNDYSCASIYSGHNYPIWCMDTSAFDLYIATGSHDRTAKLWSLDRKFPLRVFAGHFLDVNCIKFHPNTRYLATGSADKSVRLWNKDDGNLLRVFVGAQSTIYSLAFSPDGKYLAAAGDDKSIAIWDLATNAILTELKGHQETIMNLDWSPDGQYIASGSADGIVRLWPSNEYINTGINPSTNTAGNDMSQIYSTNCSNILSLQYYHRKNNSLVCIGVV
ncbi:TAF5-like RNA polymerase II p300/CBP-associated factor-associated factor 65 kDa subunit 5L [Fopius arisanus]|uniref:TAF5-like RNA polymerase II p300/CBP-associated factor-associated factor 65 kDa subunit 5L n=1 Tax=Fopius arisanus TaxID=64838 RepID=A0A0C9R6A3_9HYME|nr:PREDICTED: TAF5-like RNA polymerase II p300/CBP-associated factor-associated factor 65 kDa subunit 5L [Fopius arisanus]